MTLGAPALKAAVHCQPEARTLWELAQPPQPQVPPVAPGPVQQPQLNPHGVGLREQDSCGVWSKLRRAVSSAPSSTPDSVSLGPEDWANPQPPWPGVQLRVATGAWAQAEAAGGAAGEAMSADHWEPLPTKGKPPWYLLAELAESSPSSGESPPSQPSTVTLEDLGLVLVEGLASPEPLSMEILEKYESSPLASTTSVPEQDTSKCWKQLEQWVADLQAEVAYLRGHKERCEHATLSLLRELLQLQARVQLQDSELKQLQQASQLAAQAPEKEAPEIPSSQNQNQMQALDKRLVEVREALAHIRRKQVLQDSERKGAEQEVDLRLAKLSSLLRQEEQGREAACGALQKSQEDTSQRVDCEVARMQSQVTKLGEEMSLRFLKREAKLCGFLQKSFLAIEKRMKASEGMRLKAESSLREELEGRWQQLWELSEERVRVLRGQREQEEGHLLEQCRVLDAAVVQLTKFVRQNQATLNRVLLAEQKARDAKGRLEESQAGELASYMQENLEAVQLAGELAQQETNNALELLQEKSQALEVSVAELVRQVKDLSDHFLALSWRLELQQQTLGLRLSEAKTEWEGAERKSLEDMSQWQKEVAAHLREVEEKVDGLPQQIEGISDKCILHQRDLDLKISAEGKAREFAVRAVQQELATLLLSVQLLKEDSPGRKIAEIQGKLATFQSQIIKLENSIQANKTIQNLKFNTETKLRMEEIAALRESMMRMCGKDGPWVRTWSSRRALTSLVRQRLFVKDTAPGRVVPMNFWGLYQAVRWLQWKTVLMNLVAQRRPGAISKSCVWKPTPQCTSLPLPQK
ncbi:PREDICTED: coiled-coil domain-containing protein 154 [Galeopterus variegatus]|uniref:Coiled-coil domain-containing protein 154 n=1 Tax=Galeopterus variegatus TaxID=482537 RepID=A0ABM0RHS5_GALVR|nr:PREDICTED: coiled-coil domain-containing protein 154 [Galeopterus variegatus]